MIYNKEEYKDQIDKTKKELKDFQSKTVDYVYEKLYVEKRNKFLVADEVGLGKTIVAKGLIAKAFEKFKPTPSNPTFNVIYICSNQALAQENLKKLNFTKQDQVIDDPLNRLIYLAFKRNKEKTSLKFDALTPATSLTISNRSGSQYERAIIYSLLAHYAPFYKRKLGLKWLLKGNVANNNWSKRINEYHLNRKDYFEPETFKKFKDVLKSTNVTEKNLPNFYKYLRKQKDICIWDALMGLCRVIDHTNYDNFKFKNEIIVCLRHLLTKICLEYLSADLIILDEFQKYAEIIAENTSENFSPAIELAQAVFELKNTKVLMLSATPFKPFTTLAEQEKSEGHYKEFQSVLNFLLKNKASEFWKELESDRRLFFSKLNNPSETLQNLPDAVKLKERIQLKYNEAIVRTERNKVSDDRNALVKASLNAPMHVHASDIKDFIAFDKLVQKLKDTGKYRIATPIEYSKSCPYPISFLDGYQIKDNLREMKEDESFKKYLKENKTAWIDLGEINKYRPLGDGVENSKVPNSKMQFLLENINKSGSWKWLWIPPTINYYKPELFYPETSTFSKTLVFSSWKLVPRAISTIVSYEAEQHAMNAYFKLNVADARENYFSDSDDNKRRKPTPILTFKKKAGTSTTSAMSLFTLLYPSMFLSEIYDPASNLIDKKSIAEIINELTSSIKNTFYELGLDKYVSKEGVSDRWYWAAPILLDKYKFGNNLNLESLLKELSKNELAINSDNYSREEEVTGKNEKLHIEDLLIAFNNPENIGLGTLPEDLFAVLALMCVSSPSVCFMRSLQKQMNKEHKEVFKAAYSFGISKMHFFNKPESISITKAALIDNFSSYWLTVLKYCLEGNLQSSLDEFIHLLLDGGNSLNEMQTFFSDVLSLRTATIKVDDYNSFKNDETKRMRTHYAVDFGTQNLETDSGTDRVINLRQAFNSPYRPFVLASTSIGQEGLDFHYYCGQVMHWNLPGNAIDIEQREGRINRYKGYIIRKNVVSKYLDKVTDKTGILEIWKSLFQLAQLTEGKGKGKCELVPFWHVEPDGEIKIERIVPLYPFSKDIQKFKSLKDTLTYYRLTFGQPRQEELIDALQQSGLHPDEVEELRKNLLMDLSPK
jgi:hypothetical protein